MLLLAPEIWRVHGGVQRYMRMIGRILADHDSNLVILALLDKDTDAMGTIPASAAICCGGSKLRFCMQSLRLAGNGSAQTTVVGRIALLPLAWTLYKLRLIERYAVVLHGIEAWRRLSWISRKAARDSTAIVATTQYTAREFCFHNRLPESNCIVIPLACTFSAPGSRRDPPSAELRILWVSRLSITDGYKGVDTLVRAVRLGRDSGLCLTLEIVGSGDDAPRLRRLAASLGIEENVSFRGAVPDIELERLLRQSHPFAMPSKKDGFGILFLEAMAAGLPCIGANHGGTPEVIQHGENGFLIEYGDASQLLFYLRTLADSPALYKSMSDAARCRVTGALSFEAMRDSWSQLLALLTGSETLLATQPADVR